MKAAQIEALRKSLLQAVEKSTLLSEEDKAYWSEEVLPTASYPQLQKIETTFKEEWAAYEAEASKIRQKANIIREACNKVKHDIRAKREKDSQLGEEKALHELEAVLEDL